MASPYIYSPGITAAATASAGGQIFLGATFGLLGGVAVGTVVEFSLQEFERKFMETGEQEWRWWTAQGIRTVVVGGGAGITVTAALGLLGIGVATTVCVASAGIGLAVIGACGIAYAVVRYLRRKEKNKQLAEAREAVKRELASDQKRLQIIAEDITHLSNEQITLYLHQIGDGSYKGSDLMKAVLDLQVTTGRASRMQRVLTFIDSETPLHAHSS